MGRNMKDSGIDWIEEIPINYRLIKIKRITDIYTGKSINDDLKEKYRVKTEVESLPYISTKNIKAIYGYIDYKDILFIPKNEKGFRVAPKNSVLICIEGGSAGRKIAFTDNDVNFVNKLCCLRSETQNNKFIYYFTLSDAFSTQFKLLINGLIGGVSVNSLSNINIVLPPLNEQGKIVEFLDKKISQINDIMSKQKMLIEKYKDYKKSLITETVTKGLNKNIAMKDSGIEMLDQIPSHWEITRIKYLVDFNPSYSENLKYDESVSFAPMECIGDGYINFKEAKLESVKGKYTYFSNQDIVMAKVTPCFENGNIAIAKDLLKGVGFGSSELYVFRCNDKIDTKFMFYYLRNNKFKNGCMSTMTGTGGLKRVSLYFIANYAMAIPQIEEQQEIAEFLDKKCSEIDSLIENKVKLIEKLEEYKKSLIYECVTGKREV